jgi:hypothetical protein
MKWYDNLELRVSLTGEEFEDELHNATGGGLAGGRRRCDVGGGPATNAQR